MALTVVLASQPSVVLIPQTVTAANAATYQYARAASDITAGGWTPSTGATLYGTVDEAVTDDADYDISGASPVNDLMILGLSSISTPDPTLTSGNVKLRVRGRLA